ncbi:MAG: cupin domain-containing protein [Spirochaetaceae bacterium]
MAEAEYQLLHLFRNDPFPNNEELSLVLYELPPEITGARAIEELFSSNRWDPAWRYGVFPYHHYHSTAHEALGCYAGEAEIQFGGPGSRTVHMRPGMVVVIPAGVAHCDLGSSSSFACVGAYPPGQQWDLLRGVPGELELALANISSVPLPESDPVRGEAGPVGPDWPSFSAS